MFGWTTAELFIRHFIRQPEHGEGQRAHKLLIMLVGVAGFEPATPSSRTRCATTSIRSAIRALAHLGIRNVAVVTPYPQELHQSALSFLAASGFRVIAEHTMDVVFKRLQDVTPAQIFATAKRILASAPSADGVYIPCNQWSGADAAPLIESELGIPVVTGAHADWEAFRSLGINDRNEGHGRLMLSLSEMAPAPIAAAARG